MTVMQCVDRFAIPWVVNIGKQQAWHAGAGVIGRGRKASSAWTAGTSKATMTPMNRFQPDPHTITWRMHFRSPPSAVYQALTTDEGRMSFWAERTVQRADTIHFEFPGGVTGRGRVLATEQDRLFRVEYFDAVATFELEPTDDGGTDLHLTTHGFAAEDREELLAGWLNVLFPMKAWVDHGIDLRNHDADRTWWHGYADQ